MVVPLIWSPTAPQGSAAPQSYSALPKSQPVNGWIMPSILGVCIVLAGLLDFLAARMRHKTPQLASVGLSERSLLAPLPPSSVALPTHLAVGISTEQSEQIKLAGVLESKAGQADWLARELERVWHTYNNDHQVLLRPLAETTLPDAIQTYREKKLFEFRVQYRGHIGGVRFHVPHFHDTIMDGPAYRNIEYLDLREQLKEHANRLRQLARSLLVSGVPVVDPIEIPADKSLLSPLQVEALQLAKELQQFQKQFPFNPTPPEDTAEWIVRSIKEKSEYSDQLGHAYVAGGFAERVTKLVHKLGAMKMNVAELEQYEKWVGSEDNVRNLIKSLWRLAQEM